MKAVLVGNQNSGKTTLFNLLTGMNQKIGNWPGVTIEKKSGTIKTTDCEITDIPGVYSLSPYTSEEVVSREFILKEKIDLIINIVDATSLERSLYLTSQLKELDANVILVLNMADIMENKGVTIDTEALSKAMDLPVYKISALKKTGIEELIFAIKSFKKKEKKILRTYPEDLENEIDDVAKKLTCDNKRFLAIKILEQDPKYKELLQDNFDFTIEKLSSKYQMDIEQLIAHQRYNFIEKIKPLFLTIVKKTTFTDRADKIILNRFAAIPIFIVIMTLVYFISVGVVGTFTVDLIGGWIESFQEVITNGLMEAGASLWAISLLSDGIIGGVGAVLSFVPQLILLFLMIALLEASGYMSRIAFMLDMLFKKLGLSGKSIIPFIVGAGCSVPGIMTTRTVESEDERMMTITLTPFIPCSAKLPIIAAFSSMFFPKYQGVAAVSLYFFAIIVILLSALIMKKFIFKGKHSSYISELPEYKFPSVSNVARDVYEKTWGFIKRAGSIIFLSSIIIWFLVSFNFKFEYGKDISESMLSWIGRSVSWLFYPMLGTNSWAAAVSALQGLIAKEQVISSMEIIAGVSGADSIFSSAIFSFFAGPSAYAFMVFNLFSAPCIGAIGAMKKEFNSTKKVVYAVLFQTVLAFLLSYLVFGIGSLIGGIL